MAVTRFCTTLCSVWQSCRLSHLSFLHLAIRCIHGEAGNPLCQISFVNLETTNFFGWTHKSSFDFQHQTGNRTFHRSEQASAFLHKNKDQILHCPTRWSAFFSVKLCTKVSNRFLWLWFLSPLEHSTCFLSSHKFASAGFIAHSAGQWNQSHLKVTKRREIVCES